MTAPPRSAMVLAAGLGTRLRPLTQTLPKALIEINGRALIDHAIDRLMLAGVESVVVNIHHKAAVMKTHLARRDHPRIMLSEEDELLDTGGGVARALPFLGEVFFVLNGDVVWLDRKEPALLRLAEALDPARMDAVLLLQPTVTAVGYDGPGDYFLESRENRGAAASARSPPISSPAFNCCTAGSSTACPSASSRWSGCSTAPKRRAGCARSCTTASGTTSALRKGSRRPANASPRAASSAKCNESQRGSAGMLC